MNYDFTEIYKSYSPRIQLYLSRLVGRDNAEDLMQEVFIKVYNSLDSFEGNSQISTWLYKIATNTAIDKLKNFKYRKEKNQSTSLDYVEHLKSSAMADKDDSDVEYNFLKQEMNQCIADYINKLPDSYRAIFILREYDDVPFEEIASILDISFDNVKIRLHRARKKLHEILMANCTFYYDQHSKLCCDKK